MIKKIELLMSVVLLLSGFFFGGSRVSALDTSNFNSIMTVSPPTERIILTPGEKYEGSVTVSNSANATRDLKYSVRIGSFGLGKDENGRTDYNSTDIDTITGYNQIMDWISLGKKNGSVPPHSSDTIPYTIEVPENAPAGGQYLSIVIRDDTKEDDESSGNVTIQNVIEFAVSLLAEVTGETVNEGAILDNSIPTFLLNNQLTASSLVKDEGNVHTDAEYVLQVWPLFSDEEICTNEEKPDISIVMPEAERYHVQTCNLPSIGIFKAKQTVKIFGETSVVERMVIVCPLWLLFLILFVIVALIIWIAMKMRGSKKQKRTGDE